MSYQALYRAWRPEVFSDVVGQEPIITTLVNQILTNRIAHAYLFCGSRGTGKTSTAKVFARAINCMNPDDQGEPCGHCEACEALSHENNMDVIEIDAASNNGVDEIRELRDKIKYPPSVVRYKVYIIDEVHMLSTGAFNALLKTLEEPPSHAVFILATTEPQKLPATILSRCQRFDFKRIPAKVIVARLRQVLAGVGREADDAALDEIARSAEGGMRDAISLMDMCLAYGSGPLTSQLVLDVLGASDRGSLFAFAQALIDGNAKEALDGIDRQMQSGRDAQVFAREVAGHLRALMIAQFAGDDLAELLELAEEDARRYREQAKGVPSEKLMRLMELFIKAENDMRWASRPRSVLELCAVRGCHPEREQSIETLTERVAQLEQRLAKGDFAAPAVSPRNESVGNAQSSLSALEQDDLPFAPPSETSHAPFPNDAPPDESDPAPWEDPVAMAVPTEPVQNTPAPAIEPMRSAEPVAAPKQPEAATEDDLWQKTVQLIRTHQPALYQPVSNLKYLGEDGDIVQLAVPKKWNMFLMLLQQDSKRQLIEQQMAEAYGRPMHAQIVAEGESQPKPARPPAQQSLQQAYDLFGRENVSVLDE